MQQWTLLRESGMKDPDPIKIFYTDLEKFLAGWIAKGTEIILMLDANETIGEKPGGLATVICLVLVPPFFDFVLEPATQVV
jgi:hypothetical protein